MLQQDRDKLHIQDCEEARSHMNEHCFDPRNLISIIGFLATFKLTCDVTSIHEGAAMEVLLFFIKNSLSATLYSCMTAAAHITLAVTSVKTFELLIQRKLLRS